MNRKRFLFHSSASVASLVFNPFTSFAQGAEPEPYKTSIVKEFVGAGHGNLDKVKQMLADYPNLLYSSYDWGNGDFEQAIEGAGHVGHKEIANYLIEQGARPNIYVLTMLGETEMVKSLLTKYPALIHGRGPHGLSLLHHAQKGGDAAKELLDFIKEKGLTETKFIIK